MSSAPGEQYQDSGDDAYEGATNPATTQDDYQSRTGQSHIPVQSDNAAVDDPIDPATADSDETLERDDQDAIDKSNIIAERTRGSKPEGSYQEPGDEEGLGGNDGRSRVAGGPQ